MLLAVRPHNDPQLEFEITNPRTTSIPCSTCCPSCSNERNDTRFIQAPAYFALGLTFTSFDHLLAAGSLTLPLLPGGCPCSHQHAEDGFHVLQDVLFLRPCLHAHDAEVLNALSYLIQHGFALVSYMVTPSATKVALRLYLIPYDLPGSKGILRTRDEDRIMKPARASLRKILPRLSSNWSLWNGEDARGKSALGECFFPADKDGRSLSQIFNDLTTGFDGSDLQTTPRLRTPLYEYQKASVASMLEMETPNRISNDPLYIPIRGMTDQQFYFQPTTMELLLQCPRSYQVRGGILCEELGTGKTVITLALILATLDVLPDPPEEDGKDILTPLALRHFPQHFYSELRDSVMLGTRRGIRATNEGCSPVPSLVEILCDYTRKCPSVTDLRTVEDLPLWGSIRRNVPFYFHFYSDTENMVSARQKRRRAPRLTYLSSATLIVVPPALQAQWYSEILKHCSSSVRTFVIKNTKDLPPPAILASDYDIVLVSSFVISVEAIKNDLSALDTGYICQCPEFANIRIPDCSCPPPGNISPLLQIRWKRLVRDEGHNAASPSTALNQTLRVISAERKWIVTGTPTTNLLGLNFGSFTGDKAETDSSSQDGTPAPTSLHPYSHDEERTLERSHMLDVLENGVECRYPTRDSTWNKADREDLRKLGSMLSVFLGVLPFAAERDAFSNLVVNGLMGGAGPLPGTTRVLEQVMAASMVRHRAEDIERHVQLPPLSEKLVLLDLEEYGQISYNVLLSFVAVNAVDSERKDMDYLFHPSNTAALSSTIENLSHSLFWRSDEDAFDYELSDNIHRAENAILHAQERGQPEEDILLVQKAISHLRKALENRQYRDMQHGLEVPYHILYASQRIRQTWGLIRDSESALQDPAPFLIYPSYALELRETVVRQPLIKEDSLAAQAVLLRAKNKALADFVEATKSKADRRADSRSSSRKRRRREEVRIDRAKLDSARRTATVDSKEKLQELQQEFLMAQDRLKAEALKGDWEYSEAGNSVGSSPTTHDDGFTTIRNQLLRRSPYAQLRMGSSTSSKLNYILEEVRKYSATEKFLIFSSQPFNLVHISEGLDLIGIKYVHFMKDVDSSKGKELSRRDKWLTTFETSETYRVLLMELKYGARGLNIISASRVIFCEPVWRPDVESQAIKRVHRIGQTRPVTVKTLAIRGTFEEYMVQRRRDFKGSGSKTPGLTEEWGIRNYLQNPVFLETPPQDTVNLDFPLLPIEESGTPAGEQELERVDASNDGPEDGRMGQGPDVKADNQTNTWGLKRRKVHFN